MFLMLNFIKNLSPIEVGAIVLVLVILFGSKIVARLARTSGESLKEIKKVKKNFTEALEDSVDKPKKG